MMASTKTAQNRAEPYQEPDIGDVLAALWRGRVYVLGGALAGLVLAFLWGALAVPVYKGQMLTGPAQRPASGADMQALLPDNSSFAIQYLVNMVGRAETGDFILFENILRGPRVAAQLLDDAEIMDKIAQDRRWRVLPPDHRLSNAEALADYLARKVMIEPVGTAPLRRLVYHHPDPVFAAALLARLYDIADTLIRADIRAQAEERASYLTRLLAETRNPDHRRAVTALLMEQEHMQMVLAMDAPFAAVIAEPAYTGIRPSWPRKALIFPLLILIGAGLGFALSAARHPG